MKTIENKVVIPFDMANAHSFLTKDILENDPPWRLLLSIRMAAMSAVPPNGNRYEDWQGILVTGMVKTLSERGIELAGYQFRAGAIDVFERLTDLGLRYSMQGDKSPKQVIFGDDYENVDLKDLKLAGQFCAYEYLIYLAEKIKDTFPEAERADIAA